jgi:hypothetical protein
VTEPKDDPAGERFIDIEMQRSYMQQIIRDCNSSIIIAIDTKGEMVSAFMNLNPIERRGMIELLGDTAPSFFAIEEEGDDDADTD